MLLASLCLLDYGTRSSWRRHSPHDVAASFACHGSNVLGNQALGAPRLAGHNSAYLARQLAAFRNGQRGGMAGDKLGKQMAVMSKLLPAGKAEQDTLAYIATLKP